MFRSLFGNPRRRDEEAQIAEAKLDFDALVRSIVPESVLGRFSPLQVVPWPEPGRGERNLRMDRSRAGA